MAPRTARKDRLGREAKKVVGRINEYYAREPDFFSRMLNFCCEKRDEQTE